jgi:hypothetical protein
MVHLREVASCTLFNIQRRQHVRHDDECERAEVSIVKHNFFNRSAHDQTTYPMSFSQLKFVVG